MHGYGDLGDDDVPGSDPRRPLPTGDRASRTPAQGPPSGAAASDADGPGSAEDPSPFRGPEEGGAETEETRRQRLRESGHALRESGQALIESGAARVEASSAALREAGGAAIRRVEEKAPAGVADRIRRFRERIRHRRSLDTAWRVGVAALGFTLLIAGAVMFVVPGPGFATVILALVILGSEFAWATRLLTPVKGAAQRAAEAAKDPRRRRRNLILAGVAGVAAGLVAGWYFSAFGLTVQPLLDLSRAAWEWVTGLFG